MKLKSLDGQVLNVDDQVVNMFTVVKTMLLDLGDDDSDENPIPVNVNAKVLQQVITWCEHHKNDAVENDQSVSSSDSSGDEDDEAEEEIYTDRAKAKAERKFDLTLGPWDEKFLKELDPQDEDAIFPLILAANYLDVPKLLDTCCMYIASIIRGRTPQWVRKRFHLKCDFTEDQKAKIRQELSWYDENFKISDDEEDAQPQETSANNDE